MRRMSRRWLQYSRDHATSPSGDLDQANTVDLAALSHGQRRSRPSRRDQARNWQPDFARQYPGAEPHPDHNPRRRSPQRKAFQALAEDTTRAGVARMPADIQPQGGLAAPQQHGPGATGTTAAAAATSSNVNVPVYIDDAPAVVTDAGFAIAVDDVPASRPLPTRKEATRENTGACCVVLCVWNSTRWTWLGGWRLGCCWRCWRFSCVGGAADAVVD